MKTPTQKGKHLFKCTELSLKRNERIKGQTNVALTCYSTRLDQVHEGG